MQSYRSHTAEQTLTVNGVAVCGRKFIKSWALPRQPNHNF